MDVAAIRGVDKTFRIRVGRYRIIFTVDKKENIMCDPPRYEKEDL